MKLVQKAQNLILFLGLTVILWVVLFFVFRWAFEGYQQSEDISNAISSLFSALAFAGIIYTINQQKEELSLQRQELSDTRKEFEIQNTTQKKQRFDNTIFNIINLHHSIINDLSIFASGEAFKGRGCLRFLYQDFYNRYERRSKESNIKLTVDTIEVHRSAVRATFSEFYLKYEEHLSHYFNNFVTMANFIKHSDSINAEEKEVYYTVVRSQLNPYEIILIFYYFNVGHGSFNKELFNDLKLISIFNPGLLADLQHSMLFDPDNVVKTFLSTSTSFPDKHS